MVKNLRPMGDPAYYGVISGKLG